MIPYIYIYIPPSIVLPIHRWGLTVRIFLPEGYYKAHNSLFMYFYLTVHYIAILEYRLYTQLYVIIL